MKKVWVILGSALLVIAVGMPLTSAFLTTGSQHVAEIQPIDPTSHKVAVF